jgi:hypothetical protein
VRQKRVPIDGEMVIVRPAKEVPDVVGGERNSPRALAVRSRRKSQLEIGDAARSGHRSLE